MVSPFHNKQSYSGRAQGNYMLHREQVKNSNKCTMKTEIQSDARALAGMRALDSRPDRAVRTNMHTSLVMHTLVSFLFSLREPSHQTKAAATGTSDAAVLNQKLVWYCESEHACFVLFFFSIFFPPCPVNGSGYHSFYFFFRFLPLLSTMCKFS